MPLSSSSCKSEASPRDGYTTIRQEEGPCPRCPLFKLRPLVSFLSECFSLDTGDIWGQLSHRQGDWEVLSSTPGLQPSETVTKPPPCVTITTTSVSRHGQMSAGGHEHPRPSQNLCFILMPKKTARGMSPDGPHGKMLSSVPRGRREFNQETAPGWCPDVRQAGPTVPRRHPWELCATPRGGRGSLIVLRGNHRL